MIKQLKFSKKNVLRFINKDKSNKKRLQKECHELWREIVFLKANNKCEYPNCQNTNQLNPHHYRTKGAFPHLRYDIENGIALCAWHHTLGGYSAHKDPNFKEVIINSGVRTKEWSQRIDIKAQSKSKLDLPLIKIYLEQELNKLKI